MTLDPKALAAAAVRPASDADDIIARATAARLAAAAVGPITEKAPAPEAVPGPPGPPGEPGPQGEPGDMGPMPAHRWQGTKLQFEQAPGGEWGEAVDLKGETGEPGRPGAVGVVSVPAPPAPSFSGYFPGGW